LIHDGVELPRLVRLAKAAEILGVPKVEVEELIRRRKLQSARLNGILHVVTDSIADRLGEKTPSRHNRDSE
jgi:plasmid maintenance system antidote protein VapI